MEKEFVSYEQAVALKELGLEFETDYTFGRFYTKPRSKMFGVDEEGRHYPIKNTPKKLYTLGDHFVLSDINVIAAPIKQQVFRWFREKYNLHYRITYYDPIKAIEFQADYQGFLYKTSAASFDGSLYLPHQSYWKLKDSPYSTYEEAENACIDKLIELAKQQDK